MTVKVSALFDGCFGIIAIERRKSKINDLYRGYWGKKLQALG